MGHLSNMLAHGKGPRPKTVNRDPLRKIVDGYRTCGGIWMEILECGHEQAQKHDLMGPTNAVRRRCWRCAKEKKK